MKPEILFENTDYVAYNKPSGLLSIPDRFNAEVPSLSAFARQSFPQLYIVHRLDKDTSGVICFAKNETAHRHLSECFAHHKVEKGYQTIVAGTPLNAVDSLTMPMQADPSRKGKMQTCTKGKNTRTDYQVLKSWKHFSLLNIQLFTGRTHQIRVHLSHIGHPVVCDSFYGNGQPFFLSSVKRKYKLSDSEEQERPLLNRLALHATQLAFTTAYGEQLNFQSPLPKDMQAMIKQLGKWDGK